MIEPRANLEREILSVKDRLEVAVEAARNADALLRAWVPSADQERPEFRRLHALVKAIAAETALGKPLLVRFGWNGGLKEASNVADEIARREGAGDEWKAACAAVREEVERRLALPQSKCAGIP